MTCNVYYLLHSNEFFFPQHCMHHRRTRIIPVFSTQVISASCTAFMFNINCDLVINSELSFLGIHVFCLCVSKIYKRKKEFDLIIRD